MIFGILKGERKDKMKSWASDIYAHFGVRSPFDPNLDLLTSPIPFVAMSTVDGIRYLFIYMILYFCGCFSLLGNITPVDGEKKFLVWFTYLPIFVLFEYYICACANFHDFIRRRMDRNRSERNEPEDRTIFGYWLQDSNRFSQLVYVTEMTAVRTFPLHVAIVFWLFFDNPQSYSPACATNLRRLRYFSTSCALFEVMFTNTPSIPWTHLFPCTAILAIYLRFLYRFHPVTVGTVYPGNIFLDSSSRRAVGSEILAQCIVFVGVFTAVKYMVHVRIHLPRVFTLWWNLM